MGKLNAKQVRNIIHNWKYKQKSISWLSFQYGVCERRIRQILAYYKENHCSPVLHQRGRKKTKIPDSEVKLILSYHDKFNLGPVYLEKLIKIEEGIHIPHNRIYRVLSENNRITPNPKKQKQRKYHRYEREHSMSLWHGDWKLFRLQEKEHWLISFIDDSSRLITCYGVFEHATAANTVAVLKRGFEEYGIPDAIVTDNGTQFVPINSNDPMSHEFVGFLHENGVKHIRAHPSHPQTNGKIERAFEEVERRIGTQFETIEEFVKWQNYIKPHRGLSYKRPAEVFFNRLQPERVFWMVRRWFQDE